MTRIIDVHGAHLLDFERFHLENKEFEEAKELGYPVVDCINDIKEFLGRNPFNITTILPPPAPIFNYMRKKGKFDFDHFPFSYENTQMMQVMTFVSKLGLEDRVFPYIGFSLEEQSEAYFDYLKKVVKKVNCRFKLHPLAMQTPISKLKDSKFIDFASELESCILVHTGRDKYSDSRNLIKIAKEYPKINFCAAHFGYFRKEFLEGVSEIPNLFLDTCILSALLEEINGGDNKHVNLDAIPLEVRKSSNDGIFNWIIDQYKLEDKILFGSDIKWTYHVGSNREKEIKFAEEIKYLNNKKDKWLYSNAKRFLKLK